MASLKILKLKCTARCKYKLNLGNRERLGNTLRGAFGNTLTWLYDDHPNRRVRKLQDVIFKNKTVPAYKDELGVFAIQENYINPYVIEIPKLKQTDFDKGDILEFNIILFGSACDYIDEVTTSVRLMFAGRIGIHIDAFEPENIAPDEIQVWHDNIRHDDKADKLTVMFLEETHLNFKGDIQTDGLPFDYFMFALVSRITLLCNGYSDGAPSVESRRDLLEQARSIRIVRHDLRTAFFNNHSRTHGKDKVRLSGFTGTIEYSGDMSKFINYIQVGADIHVGNETTRGMGLYAWRTQ